MGPPASSRTHRSGAVMHWFGLSWGAPVNATNEPVETPVGLSCVHCGEAIQDDDQGLLMPDVRGVPDDPDKVLVAATATHLACFHRAVGTIDPRRIRRVVNRLAEILYLARGEAADEYRRRFANRASGSCICDVCGAEYSRHADDPFAPYLNVLCDERRVKL